MNTASVSKTKIKKGKYNRSYIVNLSLALVIIILVVLFGSLNKDFIGFNNIMNIIRQTSVIAVVAIGMTFVIIGGGIDLSVGSNVAFGGAVGAILITQTGSSILGILGSLISCAAIGALNGIAIGRFGISPLMMTLGTMALARGLTLGLLHAVSIIVKDDLFNWLGQGEFGSIPVVVIFLLIVYVFFYFFSSKNSFGLRVYAIGGNKLAAKASGVNTKNIIMYTYVITGLLVGFASIITVGRLLSAQPWSGLGLEFDVITAVIIGGTSLKGGEGNMIGTLFGAAVVGVLTNGMSFLSIPPFYQYIFKGLIILAVVYIDNVIHRSRV
ncbi:MAG: ABC transporter permease [Atribacterota bacterium]